MEKRVVLQQLEVAEGRFVLGYFFLQVLEEGVEIARRGPHLVTAPPDADLDALLAGANNDITNRPGMRWPAIDAVEWKRFADTCAIHQTPEVKAGYAAWKAEQEARIAADQAARSADPAA